MSNLPNSFAFFVLAYNHENYIIEHLESIKYLVENYGQNIAVDLVVNDDFSKDQTVELVESWLSVNSKIFRKIITLYNDKNIGTCLSVINMLKHLEADVCKLTAGDDVYSYENIFKYGALYMKAEIASGISLSLVQERLFEKRLETFLAVASQIIYDSGKLTSRFKHFSYNNAPNIFYAKKCLTDEKLAAFLTNYDVVEDWPLQIYISEAYPDAVFELIGKTFVYYRRTSGSIFIVANSRFVKDKLKVYTYLIDKEVDRLERLRIKSRRFCFELSNKYLKFLLNIDLYFFVFASLKNIKGIVQSYSTQDLSLSNHQSHYLVINKRAGKFLNNLNSYKIDNFDDN
jgi:hypothetical protein